MQVSIGVAAISSLALAFISAILPWVNAEALVLALPAIAQSRAQLTALVVVVTVGQMAGKCVVYCAGRRGARIGSARTAERLARWQARAATSPRSAVALVAFSSIVGLPPFYLMSAFAGAIRMNLGWFLAAGTFGRLVRFGGIAFGALSVAGRL